MKQDKRCLDYQKVIKESAEELLRLERHQSKALLRDRVRFLRLLKSGECGSQGQAGQRIGLKLRASERLWSSYHHEGLQALLTYPYQGTKGKLSPEQKQQLQEELSHDHYQTTQQVCDYVEQQFNLHYTPSGMLYVFKCLKVKKKTGRPQHEHKDHKGEQRFKKTLPALKQLYGKRIYMMDEMRSGTRTQHKRRWTPKGHRPVCKVKLGYEFTYLYAAMAPATGKLIALLPAGYDQGFV